MTDTVQVLPEETGPAPGRRRGSLLAASGMLVRRRLWRDRGLLAASTAIVALATVLAVAGPEVVLTTIDEGAEDAVDSAGPAADIVVTFPVGNTAGDNVQSVRGVDPTEFTDLASSIEGRLPSVVADQVADHAGVVTSRELGIVDILPNLAATADPADPTTYAPRENDDLWEPRLGTFVQFGVVDDPAWQVVDGALPEPPAGDDVDDTVTITVDGEELRVYTADGEIVQVAMTAAVADNFGIDLGGLFVVEAPSGQRVVFELVAIVTPAADADPADESGPWGMFPEASQPVRVDNSAQPLYTRGTLLLTPDVAAHVSDSLGQPFDGTVTLDVVSEGITLSSARQITTALSEIQTSPAALLPSSDVSVEVDTELDTAMRAYPARARAALAQMSVMVAGVIGVAAVVIALMARLLLSRRSSDIALERARGASLPSITVRLLIESAIFTALGVAGGYAAAVAVVGDAPVLSGTVALVALVAVSASPLLGFLRARRTWTGKRAPANRQDRAKQAKARVARRWTLDALAIALAGAAVVTLRGRGVLQTQTSGIDPFLAAAPLLLALGMTIVVLRLYPIPMRIIQAFAKRTRGVGGVITLAKARQAIPVLPLLALTLAISVAVAGGLLIATVRGGQEQASWERVGGQVRIDQEFDAAALEALTATGTDPSIALAREATTLRIGNSYEEVYLLAVDAGYADVVEAGGVLDPASYRALEQAAADFSPGDPVPALASDSLLQLDFAESRSAYVGREYVDLELIGEVTARPDGWAEGPYLIVPLEALLTAEFETPVAPNLALFDTAVDLDALTEAGIAPAAVSTRAGWLESVRDSALIGGVERMMMLAVIAVGLLAAVALLVTVLEGVRERGIALSMLRTQGMSGRYGWWLSMSELAPLTVAAVIGGAAAGVTILVVLGSTLGLEILAGGVQPPPLNADVTLLGAVAGGVVALLLAAVSAEVTAHRRNKLSEVLRLGETR